MNRRTALGLFGIAAVPGLTGCTLFDLADIVAGDQEPGGGGGGAPGGGAQDQTVEPYVVKGRVTYADGRPLAGAEVLANNTLGSNSYLKTQSDAEGYYRIEIAEDFVTTWTMWASADIEYHGQTYTRQLDHTGEAFATADGAVVDITLLLSGPMTLYGPGSGFVHGATIHVMADINSDGFVEPAEVEITMVPTGPLLDGSTGETIVTRVDSAQADDVPVGEYQFSLAHHAPDGTVTPLQLRVGYDGEMSDSVTALLPAEDELALEYFVPASLDRDEDDW